MGSTSHGPVLLAQAGRSALTNFKFILEAPWKACRLCGSVYQSDYDRHAYKFSCDGLADPSRNATAAYYNKLGEQRRQRWLRLHNKRVHPNIERETQLLKITGFPVTPLAAQKLSTYGIIPIGPTPYEDEVAQALLEAPRRPVDDAES